MFSLWIHMTLSILHAEENRPPRNGWIMGGISENRLFAICMIGADVGNIRELDRWK